MLAEGKTADDLYKAGLISVGADGSHCTFCHRKVKCPAALAKVQETTAADFAEPPEDLEAPGPNMLTAILPWIPFIDKFLKEAAASAERQLLSGGKLEGYKLVRKKTNRAWAPNYKHDDTTVELTDSEVQRLMEEKFGVEPEKLVVTSTSRISGPQAEKLVPKAKRKEFNDFFLYKPPGGLTMAESADPRSEVVADAAGDFAGDGDMEEADALNS